MREIKFRAWNGKWMDYDFFISSDGAVYDRAAKTYDTPNLEIESIENMVLLQFTGLKDKNGQEIYSGDIVRWHSTHIGADQTEHVDTMTWSDDVACYLLTPWAHEPYAACMEVIGNIYENQELLEVCK